MGTRPGSRVRKSRGAAGGAENLLTVSEDILQGISTGIFRGCIRSVNATDMSSVAAGRRSHLKVIPWPSSCVLRSCALLMVPLCTRAMRLP